jgi:hypothetical protein
LLCTTMCKAMKKTDPKFTVTNVLKVIPERAFEKSYVSAFKRLTFSLVFFAAATALLTFLPYYLCPLGWFIASLSYTSVGVVRVSAIVLNTFSLCFTVLCTLVQVWPAFGFLTVVLCCWVLGVGCCSLCVVGGFCWCGALSLSLFGVGCFFFHWYSMCWMFS